MNKEGFEQYLRNVKKYTEKSIRSRISRAYWIEDTFGVDLDKIVSNENETLSYREKIYSQAATAKYAGSLYNALRGYYEYKNGETLPRRNDSI